MPETIVDTLYVASQPALTEPYCDISPDFARLKCTYCVIMNSEQCKHSKNQHKQISAFSVNSEETMFQPRPFVVQLQSDHSLQQPDFKTSFIQAKKYGHDLSKTNLANQSVPIATQAKLDAKSPIQLTNEQKRKRSIDELEEKSNKKKAAKKTDNPEWPLDKMAQEAHDEYRNPKYARHSTTAAAIPISHEGFGVPVISQQRGNSKTVNNLHSQFAEQNLQQPQIVSNLQSGQHADPFAVYNAFAGNFEETGELADAMLLGVSKGRCNDCDDAVKDFPVIMDEDYTLGKSTKKWEHAKRQ